MMFDIPLGKTRTARFEPKRLDTLRPSMAPLIGKTFTFYCAGISVEGEAYAGQLIWYIEREQERAIPEDARALWIPDEDLVDCAAAS